MHISFVRALWPATTVVSALSPTLSYVHDQVMLPPANWKKLGSKRFTPGCSQSVLVNTMSLPSCTAVATDCLCECVDIDQNLPGVTGQLALTWRPVACGGIEMSLL